MKTIKRLAIQGFRGFNKIQEPIDFHEKLTLISGQNSYGKTSISEALEWLLYGITSKMEDASNNKSEYLGSYRNIHLPENELPFVEAVFGLDDSTEITYRGELQDNDTIQRYLNGEKVDNWPWALDAINDPRPFILQHALKNLLLTSPSDRYQRFTKLIGEEELGNLQDHFISLSTKYDPPKDINIFLNSFASLEEKIKNLPSLEKIYKLYQKSDFEKLLDAVKKECSLRIGKNISDTNELLIEMKKLRGDTVGRYFDKQLTLEFFSSEEEGQISDDIKLLLNSITDEFSTEYLGLIKLATIQHIINRTKFLNYGLTELRTKPIECPFCGHSLTEDQKAGIEHECKTLNEEAGNSKSLQVKQEELISKLKVLKKRLEQSYTRLTTKTSILLSLNSQETLQKLEIIFSGENKSHYDAVKVAIEEIQFQKDQIDSSSKVAITNLDRTSDSLNNSTETPEKLKNMADALVKHIADIDSYKKKVELHIAKIAIASKALSSILDLQAGTQELTVLIELLDKENKLFKRASILSILSHAKELQKQVKEYVSDKLEHTVNVDLSRDVLSWYERIKTDGDPDVHFDGFELPKTKSGAIKSRQISVNAKSYNKSLSSAVSSLSESKLNALGLSISIANNIKGNSTFGFLLIDDPVQSMDAGHSVQIINIVRSLIEDEGKQVVLLSHNSDWLRDARKSCRSINGYYYEIESYTLEGPKIERRMWAAVEERLAEVKAFLDKPGLKRLDKQKIAEEFRLLYNELASDICKAKTGKVTNPDSLNSAGVRSLLIQSDFDSTSTDKVFAAYTSVSNAHHEISYDEPTQTLREYLKLALQMKQFLEEIRTQNKNTTKKKKV